MRQDDPSDYALSADCILLKVEESDYADQFLVHLHSWVKSGSQPNDLVASGFPQTADMAAAVALFSSGPEPDLKPRVASRFWQTLRPGTSHDHG
ncbi:hypothetical protein [Bradyrhizobium sp. AS23.2]|uniref:hypothetical protein n=1 Tax=Bradyrhizobium sp. AS23.2 TaxID=1680155 RepID=UPI00116140D9|nr:hypothetical protein [Bradyrhizobium sp. AS23.2]